MAAPYASLQALDVTGFGVCGSGFGVGGSELVVEKINTEIRRKMRTLR